MSDVPFMSAAVGSQTHTDAAQVAPAYLGCLCIQALGGDASGQGAAIAALTPPVEKRHRRVARTPPQCRA